MNNYHQRGKTNHRVMNRRGVTCTQMGADMRRRNRNNNVKKERAIMIASSVFVLAALTMTGVYVKQSSDTGKNDGYSIDFSALENENQGSAGNGMQGQNIELEIPENTGILEDSPNVAQGNIAQGSTPQSTIPKQNLMNMDDALDYFPPLEEAGSGDVKIPGLTLKVEGAEKTPDPADSDAEKTADAGQEASGQADAQQADAETAEQQTLADEAAMATDAANEQAENSAVISSFATGESLVWPVNGTVIIPYSMDHTVYFATLQQYKYNPGMVMAASEGDTITAAASGVVTEVFFDEEIGNAVRVDIGNGYEAVYGQLRDIQVSAGSTVEEGGVLGYVAAPTKYYSVEGCNAYFALKLNGSPVDPLGQLQ